MQPLPVPPAQALPATGSPNPIAEPTSGPAMEVAKHGPQTNGLLSAALPRDLSPWGMFLNAVLPVKIVMVGLAIASLATWTVMLAKIIELWAAKRSARRGLEILAHATSLHGAEKEFGEAKSPVGRLVAAAVGEADRSEGLAAEGIKDRAATLLSRLEAQRARAISREMGILATIGAVVDDCVRALLKAAEDGKTYYPEYQELKTIVQQMRDTWFREKAVIDTPDRLGPRIVALMRALEQ